ncbi:hypothetical protein BLNAU_499 [Blattamonas nauphoetae]|uniref:Vta1/callose synthase N-terminal domain-containing protein n=1 Tax=Blattamonas nauphoetae TaxID=2049346 RepID=A0ABQ9YLF9_9EUKA|nr:hypothetical protein BLNAU_499 [Blattamonas nauphoetae]
MPPTSTRPPKRNAHLDPPTPEPSDDENISNEEDQDENEEENEDENEDEQSFVPEYDEDSKNDRPKRKPKQPQKALPKPNEQQRTIDEKHPELNPQQQHEWVYVEDPVTGRFVRMRNKPNFRGDNKKKTVEEEESETVLTIEKEARKMIQVLEKLFSFGSTFLSTLMAGFSICYLVSYLVPDIRNTYVDTLVVPPTLFPLFFTTIFEVFSIILLLSLFVRPLLLLVAQRRGLWPSKQDPFWKYAPIKTYTLDSMESGPDAEEQRRRQQSGGDTAGQIALIESHSTIIRLEESYYFRLLKIAKVLHWILVTLYTVQYILSLVVDTMSISLAETTVRKRVLSYIVTNNLQNKSDVIPFLSTLMNQIEKEQSSLKPNKQQTIAEMIQVANDIIAEVSKNDHSGNLTQKDANKLLSAQVYYETVMNLGSSSPDIEQKCQYATETALRITQGQNMPPQNPNMMPYPNQQQFPPSQPQHLQPPPTQTIPTPQFNQPNQPSYPPMDPSISQKTNSHTSEIPMATRGFQSTDSSLTGETLKKEIRKKLDFARSSMEYDDFEGSKLYLEEALALANRL